jgi:hypothetical protein
MSVKKEIQRGARPRRGREEKCDEEEERGQRRK